jgi:hypothetical protein
MSPLAPFRHRAFFWLWLGVVIASVGTWEQMVGAQWLFVHDPNAATIGVLLATTHRCSAADPDYGGSGYLGRPQSQLFGCLPALRNRAGHSRVMRMQQTDCTVLSSCHVSLPNTGLRQISARLLGQ